MDKRIVLYLGGGVLSGVFGAGVVTRLQEANSYKNIERIEGSSAGVFNGAYFLSKQSLLGSSIYWEDLPSKFIRPSRFLTDGKVLDIDYLINITKEKKILNLDTLVNSKIPFYARVLNTKTRKIESLAVRNNPQYALRSSISAPPYYGREKRIHVDADIFNPLPLEELLNDNPDNKIVIVLNHRLNHPIRYSLSNLVHGAIGSFVQDELPLYEMFKDKVKNFNSNISLAQENKRVLLITPPQKSKTRTTTSNSRKLKETWEMGKIEADKILDFIK